MIEIWEECTRFQKTSQRLSYQIRMIIKKGWFFDLEILKIHQEINRELKQDSNTITEPSNTEKQEHSNQKEPQTNYNHYTPKPHRTNTHTRRGH